MPAFLRARCLCVHTGWICCALLSGAALPFGAGCAGDALDEELAEPMDIGISEQALLDLVPPRDRETVDQGAPGPQVCTECVFQSTTCPTCSMQFGAPGRVGSRKILRLPSDLELDRVSFYSSSRATIRRQELSNLGVLRQVGLAGVDTFDLTATLSGIEGPSVRMVEVLAIQRTIAGKSVDHLLSPPPTIRGASVE